MEWLKRKFGVLAQSVIDAVVGGSLSQDETAAAGERVVTPGMGELLRRAGAEGCVLLKNDGVLPLKKDREIAVVGRCQVDWFYIGYGSGGDVNGPYYINLAEALERSGAAYNRALAKVYRTWCASKENLPDEGWWGHWPYSHSEMPLDDVTVRFAAERADTAVVVIGRAAGEDRENRLEKGSYYLTDPERDMLRRVTAAFARTVVLVNAGSVMDMSWTEEYPISAVLLAWQGGMESGSAVCDVLYGAVSPSGRLADTIAKSYNDYPSSGSFGGRKFNEYTEGVFVGYRHFDSFAPDRVLYPFGFGLSYTSFREEPEPPARVEGGVRVSVRVTNTGALPGGESVLLWCAPPAGTLKKPARTLAAFGRTKELAPGESETLTLACDDKTLASFDESRHVFFLDAGKYRFAVNGTDAGAVTLTGEIVVERCEPIRLTSGELRERILARLPDELPRVPGKALTLDDAAEGRATLDELVAQLSDAELEELTRGHGTVSSALGVSGNAGVLGGISERLRSRGIPPVVCCDGPAGLRINRYCSLLPCGTALACTFDAELIERLYRLVGAELRRCGADVLLAPGMNIHRNPLCGRNFEYFSEDPLLSGKMAAAVVRGVQSAGVAACPKHFACNNQETCRNKNDSRVGERALREIYLRNFEICVKESKPLALMTSYNKVNGVWAHYHYDLVTTVLRGEWGFDGMVMTDWWIQKAKSPEFPLLRDNAYRVRAQVDVLMPGSMSHAEKRCRSDGTVLRALEKPDGLKRAELQRTAKNVLLLCLRLRAGKQIPFEQGETLC